MLKLLLAELRYFKYFYIFQYCLYLGLFIIALLYESNNYGDIFFLMMSSSMLFFVMLILGCGASIEEKRERFYTLLPVSVKTIGKLNTLFLILDNASIFILWIIFYLTKYAQLEQNNLDNDIIFNAYLYYILFNCDWWSIWILF